uniref:Acid-sensing ion channel 2 n=1 Tax=Castor canadensis TaxID=51338 RepID=A0A8C0W276_CASCN
MDLKESPSEGSLQPSSIQIFANTSTLHGIRHIFVYGPLTIRRVLWAVAFVGSLGLLLVESSERVSYYFSYQHVTKVDEVVAQSLVFPAVTLCNLNGFRFSRLTTNDLYHAGELLALLDVNLQIPDPHLADPTVLEALRQKANFKHYKPKQFSMLEFLHRVGHDLKDMMLYCKFKGQECGHQDFTTVTRSCPGCLGRKAERRVRVEACEQDGQSDALGGEVVLADLSGSFSLKLKACFLCVQLLHNVSAGGGGPQL